MKNITVRQRESIQGTWVHGDIGLVLSCWNCILQFLVELHSYFSRVISLELVLDKPHRDIQLDLKGGRYGGREEGRAGG